MTEAGHRCAACGAEGPFELAHIIPWHKSKSHEASNLLCLCASCHRRADKDEENWGAKTFREYKENPWVRRHRTPPGPSPNRPSSNLFLAPRRNPYFTGREEVLADLRARLVEGGSAALSQAITGLGGIGKTQTAIEYCHRYAEGYQHVLWANASSETELSTECTAVAVRLGLIGEEAQPEQAVPALMDWLNSTLDWVLVFDNADEPEVLDPFLPNHPKGHVLVTSRASVVPGFPPPLSMRVLGEDEAVDLLASRLGRELSEGEQQVAEALAEVLGYLPLALEQAGAYMRSRKMPFADYLDRFKRQRLALVEKHGPETDYRATVATTWLVSFEAVESESPAAADALRVCAFLAPEAMPYELFSQGCEHLGSALAELQETLKGDPWEVADLLAPLERYSLVELDGDEQTLGVHRLVQAVTRAELGEEAQVWQERVVEGMAAVMPDDALQYEHWPAARRLFSHVQALVDGGTPLENEAGASMLQGAGGFAKSQGWYRLSANFRQTSLGVRRRVLGEEHPDTLGSMNNLATTLHALDDFEGARDLHQQTLDACRRVLGEEHPDTLASMNNLAATLSVLGDFEGSLDLHRQTLDGRHRVLGEEHPHTLLSMNNLAATLHNLGDFEGARDLHQQTLDVKRRVLGEENPSTLNSMNNLATTLRDLGDFESARALHQRAYEGAARILGEEHPYTIIFKNKLEALPPSSE